VTLTPIEGEASGAPGAAEPAPSPAAAADDRSIAEDTGARPPGAGGFSEFYQRGARGEYTAPGLFATSKPTPTRGSGPEPGDELPDQPASAVPPEHASATRRTPEAEQTTDEKIPEATRTSAPEHAALDAAASSAAAPEASQVIAPDVNAAADVNAAPEVTAAQSNAPDVVAPQTDAIESPAPRTDGPEAASSQNGQAEQRAVAPETIVETPAAAATPSQKHALDLSSLPIVTGGPLPVEMREQFGFDQSLEVLGRSETGDRVLGRNGASILSVAADAFESAPAVGEVVRLHRSPDGTDRAQAFGPEIEFER
jgi:hypothetical protein